MMRTEMRFSQNQRGQSLIELVVFSALALLLGSIALDVATSMQYEKIRTQKRLDYAELIDSMKQVLSDRTKCLNNIGGKAYTDNATTPTVLNSINDYDPTGSVQNLLTVGTVTQGLQINSIQLVPKGNIDNTYYMADLVVGVDHMLTKTPPFAPLQFPLIVKVSTGAIYDCATADTATGMDGSTVCASQDQIYDPKTGRCKDPVITTFTGSTTGVKCGDGFVPTVYGWPCECIAPKNFDWSKEGQFSTTRCYPEGSDNCTTWTTPASTNDYNDKSMQCSCGFAVGIDPSGWKAKIYCMQGGGVP